MDPRGVEKSPLRPGEGLPPRPLPPFELVRFGSARRGWTLLPGPFVMGLSPHWIHTHSRIRNNMVTRSSRERAEMDDRIRLVRADITTLKVDCIVNAANSSLLGGGGVDGAIHRAAGPELLAECRLLGGCKTGQAKITGGYGLPARHVIHTVGPVYRDGKHGEPELLADCYRNSLEVALENGIRTIAFPCISTGVYGYPLRQACQIALDTITAFLARSDQITQVVLVCFTQSDYDLYRQVIDDQGQPLHSSV